jgi:hypothetical protein
MATTGGIRNNQQQQQRTVNSFTVRQKSVMAGKDATHLHAASNHPKHVFRGIAYNQLYRIRRNYLKHSDFERYAKNLMANLIRRGYKKCPTQRLLESPTLE